MREDHTDDRKDEEWGDPPVMDPPAGAVWEGEWQRGSSWTSGMANDDPGEPGWLRVYLELDGHEDCCHHTWPVFIPVNPWME